jgi:hypothetical protein
MLYRLQEGAYSVGHCPSPDLFRWSPDDVMWPMCEQCIRSKCPQGAACHVDRTNKWVNHQTQVSFADAQNWCAGRGKCPGSLEGRWRPGAHFYPNCSREIMSWCQRKGVYDECMHMESDAVVGSILRPQNGEAPKRVQAQQWAYALHACPDPSAEFIWNYELTTST